MRTLIGATVAVAALLASATPASALADVDDTFPFTTLAGTSSGMSGAVDFLSDRTGAEYEVTVRDQASDGASCTLLATALTPTVGAPSRFVTAAKVCGGRTVKVHKTTKLPRGKVFEAISFRLTVEHVSGERVVDCIYGHDAGDFCA